MSSMQMRARLLPLLGSFHGVYEFIFATTSRSEVPRFYTRIVNSKCKVKCDGIPILVLRSKVNHFSRADNPPNKHVPGSYTLWQEVFRWLLKMEQSRGI